MEVNGNNRFVAGGGTLSLGIIGTALGGLNALANSNGLPLLGGNRSAEADARIAKLEAERYTDAAVIEAQKRTAESDALNAALSEKVANLAVKNSEEIATLKAEMALREEIARLKAHIELLETVNPLQAAITANASEITSLKQVIGGFTKVVIPSDSVVTIGGAAANA